MRFQKDLDWTLCGTDLNKSSENPFTPLIDKDSYTKMMTVEEVVNQDSRSSVIDFEKDIFRFGLCSNKKERKEWKKENLLLRQILLWKAINFTRIDLSLNKKLVFKFDLNDLKLASLSDASLSYSLFSMGDSAIRTWNHYQSFIKEQEAKKRLLLPEERILKLVEIGLLESSFPYKDK